MQIVREISTLKRAVSDRRTGGGRLALVPTMGALHAGHLALVEEARRRADRVAASIFVNPLQFNDPGDLERYPRQEAEDLAMLEAAGCDLVWLPAADDLYPEGFATTVSVAGVSERWEGEHRPGHFDGVATVVAKLLVAAAPDVAVFGEKDFQQLAVIRRMVADLALPVEIVGAPTVRDRDGLALSSRNARLSADHRRQALALPQALSLASKRLVAGDDTVVILADARRSLEQAGFERVDYFALVDGATLEPVEKADGTTRLIAAASIGGTRLIDNICVVSDTICQTRSPAR